ncbi:MAG: hypothetical protein ACXWP6_05685 [Ktedonobacterales bacterium]
MSEHLTQGVLASLRIAIIVLLHLLSFIIIITLAITLAQAMRMMRTPIVHSTEQPTARGATVVGL